jgi:hypothetical protein
MPRAGGPHGRRRGTLRITVGNEPRTPLQPSRPIGARRARTPRRGVHIAVADLARGDVVVPAGVAGLRNDAGVVTAIREHEGELGVGEKVNLVDRLPGRDVIGLGAHHEHRHAEVFQRDNAALDGKTTGGEPVLQKQATQILRMHEIGKRVVSAFQAIRSLIWSRSPNR